MTSNFDKIIENTAFIEIKEAPLVVEGLDLEFDDAGVNDKTEKEAEESSVEDYDNNTTAGKLKNAIRPQVDIANSIILSIKNTFKDDCGGTGKYGDIAKQIKNFEKQIRGACQQVIASVDNMNFNTSDENKEHCSPKAYKTICNYDSRDRSSLDLCAAIIAFYNSLR